MKKTRSIAKLIAWRLYTQRYGHPPVADPRIDAALAALLDRPSMRTHSNRTAPVSWCLECGARHEHESTPNASAAMKYEYHVAKTPVELFRHATIIAHAKKSESVEQMEKRERLERISHNSHLRKLQADFEARRANAED